jgi:hypothetical protein
MTSRPSCLQLIDQYVAGATIAHEYAFGLHHKLVEAGAADDYTRKLVRESLAVALELSAVARRVRDLELEWSEQELLDPPAAARTAKRLEERVAKLAPEFAVLRERHKRIVSELLDLLRQTR